MRTCKVRANRSKQHEHVLRMSQWCNTRNLKAYRVSFSYFQLLLNLTNLVSMQNSQDLFKKYYLNWYITSSQYPAGHYKIVKYFIFHAKSILRIMWKIAQQFLEGRR